MCPIPRGEWSFYTKDDLECQIFIQIYREKITETIDLSSPSFLDASVKNIIYINFSLIVDVYKCKKMCIYKHFNNMHTMNIISFKGGFRWTHLNPPCVRACWELVLLFILLPNYPVKSMLK